MLPKARAIEHAIRGGVRRVHVVSYSSPEGILGEVFTNEGHRHADRGRHRRATGPRTMTRLWDKGDATRRTRPGLYGRGTTTSSTSALVRYDVHASLAHARMLHDRKLLSAADLAAITAGLTEIAAAHARGRVATSSSRMRMDRPRSSRA